MNWKVNILIDKDGRARLTDFILSFITREEYTTFITQESNPVNTTTWAAPEILRGGGATKEGDVFTFAMVAVEVRMRSFQRRILNLPALEQTFTGRPPFISRIHASMYDIMSGKRPERPDELHHDKLWETIERCWSPEPKERPTTLQLLEFFRTS